MTSNDNEDGQQFLEWVNMQRLKMGSYIPWYSLEQVKEGQFMEKVLLKLECDFFKQLVSLPFHYLTYLTKMEMYLQTFLGQKIKRNWRNKIVSQECPKDLVRLVFYICVQSTIKGEFIHRIFDLSNETQSYLMHSLNKIEENIQDVMEIKEILKKFEQLEQQNDLLKEKLKQKNIEITSLREIIKETEQENHNITKQCNMYKKDKQSVLQELGISQIQQYLVIYRQLKTYNEDLLESLQILQNKYQYSEQNCKQLLQKISSGNLVIEHLNEQITKLKANCHNVWLEMQYYQDQNLALPLKDNKTILNRPKKQIVKAQKKKNITTNSINNSTDVKELRQYNLDLMKKLELSYKQITQITQQMTIIKEDNEALTKQNLFYQQQINNLQQLYEEFVVGYSSTLIL